MKIETKYNVGDTVFFDYYDSIEKGKIVDLDISASKHRSSVVYKINNAPAWYDMFSYRWDKHNKQFREEELYPSIVELSEKKIAHLQLEIDIRNEKIRKIREQVSKELNNEP
jgi:hypothetical protein